MKVTPVEQAEGHRHRDYRGQDLMAVLAPQTRDASAQRLLSLLDQPEFRFNFSHSNSYLAHRNKGEI